MALRVRAKEWIQKHHASAIHCTGDRLVTMESSDEGETLPTGRYQASPFFIESSIRSLERIASARIVSVGF